MKLHHDDVQEGGRHFDLDDFPFVNLFFHDVDSSEEHHLGVGRGGSIAARQVHRAVPNLVYKAREFDRVVLLPDYEETVADGVDRQVQCAGGGAGCSGNHVLGGGVVRQGGCDHEAVIGRGDAVEIAVSGERHVPRRSEGGDGDHDSCDEYGLETSHDQPLRFTTVVRSVARKTSMISSLTPTSG